MSELDEIRKTANEAYQMALTNKTKMESHEETCAERYKTIVMGIDAVSGRITSVNSMMLTTAASSVLVLITALGGIVFWMLTHGK